MAVAKNIIGKHNDKFCIPTCFKYDNDLTHDPDKIWNTFSNFFTNVGPNYANAISLPQTKQFTRYIYKKS